MANGVVQPVVDDPDGLPPEIETPDPDQDGLAPEIETPDPGQDGLAPEVETPPDPDPTPDPDGDELPPHRGGRVQ